MRRLHRQFNGVVTRTSRFQDDSLEAWRSETGLSAAATAAIVDASRRGVIPQNPGVLLSRLLRFQECLGGPLGRRGVLCVLRSAPSLLRYSPESLRWNVDMLAALLPDADAAAAAARRAPMLLGASAITLWGNFEGLRRLLRLDHDAAVRLVVRAPRLLLNSRGALQGRLEALTLLAGGSGGAASRRAVAAAVARQPALLGYFPGTLERNLRAAAAVLAVPFSRVQPLLLKQPALAMLARASLRDRVASLRDAAMLYDEADLASVVLRQPSLLTLSPENVRHKVAVVGQVLELESRPEELRAVLRGAPQLLTLAADSIRTKAAALWEAVEPAAVLRAQLQRAPPQTVAVWLCMSSRRYDHVRSVAEAAAAAANGGGSVGQEEKRIGGAVRTAADNDSAAASSSRRGEPGGTERVGGMARARPLSLYALLKDGGLSAAAPLAVTGPPLATAAALESTPLTEAVSVPEPAAAEAQLGEKPRKPRRRR
ncbi:hypothetical protein VOLCADRAFT_92282 [Volvox carteri f. nagariensis]|uniref:Uncharacterized protein n=1 Tax=Volvox carteri f. nagariensis TaxID=3068 RepID=D8TZ89_VOLCA|nr:uncharacterized protein VOLCADRAFT_92282 [Volvox carteri f. nagariensis]EFJ47139.1 hypothetical protein VOLCADRAFT_92282 [Volvox carteri f. nagariensis]|eukprot:XP_002951688.1 hypothetical protein VOLCADRAFT_92282 [Volvox carteri f. nagariensis]